MSFSAPLLWSSAFYENCPQLQYNRNQCFWWETCNKVNWTSSVLNLMFTVNYCVPLTLDTEWMNLICLLIWNVHSEWTDCPSGLQLNNFLDDSKIETVQPWPGLHFRSVRVFMWANSPTHVRQVHMFMHWVVCQAESVSIYLCFSLRACLCFAHSCLINIPSEAHLVCFEGAGGAAAARAGPAAAPSHLYINPGHRAVCQQQYRPTLVATTQTTQAHSPLSLFYCPWNGACSKYYLPLCFIPPFIPESAERRKEPCGWVTFSPLFSSLRNHRQQQRLPGDERFCLLCDRCGFRQILLWWGNAQG